MDPSDVFPFAAGSGLVGLALFVGLIIGGFVLSAWIMSLYLRLVIRFSRRTFDREYRYMRGDYGTRPESRSVPTYVPPNW